MNIVENQTVQQLRHEAEYTRRHARYQIPAKFVYHGILLKVFDWSVSGLSLRQPSDLPTSQSDMSVVEHFMKTKGYSLPEEIRAQRHLSGRLIFDFNGIETAIDVELEKVYEIEGDNKIGYRFVNLDRPQIAVLHQVINAYLNGDIVAVDDVLDVIKRDAFSPKPTTIESTSTRSPWQRFMFQVRRFSGLAAMLLVLAGLLALIGNGIYHRLFIVESMAAEVDGPITVLRSLGNGIAKLTPIQPGQEVKPGQVLATLKLRNGGGNVIESPCHCRIVSWHLLDGNFVAEGEPVVTLLPVDQNLYVDAKFDAKTAEKLVIGAPAEIRLASGQTITGTLHSLRSGASLELERAAPLQSVSTHPVMYLNAVIKPDQPLDWRLLGNAAFVEVDLFSTWLRKQ